MATLKLGGERTKDKVRHLTADDLGLTTPEGRSDSRRDPSGIATPSRVLTPTDVSRIKAEYSRFRSDNSYEGWTSGFRNVSGAYRTWLQSRGILSGSPPPEEFVDQVLQVASAYSGTNTSLRISFPGRVMADNSLTKVQLALKLRDFLLGEPSLASRLEQFLQLSNIGPHVATHLLSAHDPDKYSIVSDYHIGSLAHALGISNETLFHRIEEAWGAETSGVVDQEARALLLWMKLLEEVRRCLD